MYASIKHCITKGPLAGAQFQANRFFGASPLALLHRNCEIWREKEREREVRGDITISLPGPASFIWLVFNAPRQSADTSYCVNESADVRWFANADIRCVSFVDYEMLNNLYTTMFN